MRNYRYCVQHVKRISTKFEIVFWKKAYNRLCQNIQIKRVLLLIILSCLASKTKFIVFSLLSSWKPGLYFFSHLPQVWSEENQVEKQPLQPANLFTFFLHLNCRFNPTKSNKLTQHQQIEHWHRNQINECSTMYLSLSISNSFN